MTLTQFQIKKKSTYLLLPKQLHLIIFIITNKIPVSTLPDFACLQKSQISAIQKLKSDSTQTQKTLNWSNALCVPFFLL